LISLLCIGSAYYYGWTSAFDQHVEVISSNSVYIELIFLLNIGINCLREYTPDGEIIPVRDISKITMNYIKNGSFVEDAIMIIPYAHIANRNIWHIIKIYRIRVGLKIFNV
jgi:hypothetical protein